MGSDQEEFCPSTRTAVRDGIAMLLASVIFKGVQSNAVAFIVVCPLTSLREIWFELCCLAAVWLQSDLIVAFFLQHNLSHLDLKIILFKGIYVHVVLKWNDYVSNRFKETGEKYFYGNIVAWSYIIARYK